MLYPGAINSKIFMKKFTLSLLVLICLLINTPSFAQIAPSSCTPVFLDSTLACNDGMFARITHIAGAPLGLDDETACNGSGYEDYTAVSGDSCALNAGTTYTATVKTGYSEMSCQVWIDFNNDGIFKPSESVGGIPVFGFGDGTAAISLTIPASAPAGTYRMRLVGDWYVGGGGIKYVASNTTVSIPPCPPGSIYYGDARDYLVTILSTLSTPALTSAVNVAVFPNPAINELTIKMDEGAYSSFTITNSLGQQMTHQSLSVAQTNVNVSNLPAGLYYITFRGANGTKVEKFVKL